VSNPEVELTLDDAVAEVLGILTGLDLAYEPGFDRYRAITRQLNRSLRSNSLETEWSYYSSLEEVGRTHAGDSSFVLRGTVRPRIINDDAVRLVDDNGRVVTWAYFLPRDALHKYDGRGGLWVAHTRSELKFSRPLLQSEANLRIQIPVMREPVMFRLPADATVEVPADIRQQTVDFANPDVIVLRAAYYYAQSDPVMQPRAMALEAQYKDLMYQLIERDQRNTDAPFMNEWFLPISSSIDGPTVARHRHPHSDERRF